MIADHTKISIDRYYNNGEQPGGFLEAVLSNDLFDAVARADCDSRRDLPDIVCYIYNKIPSSCHGSRQAVKDWILARGMLGGA
jgi:hypothetical protein